MMPRSFNEQNVLWDLEIAAAAPEANEGREFRVDMASSYGLGASFLCRRIVVQDVPEFGST